MIGRKYIMRLRSCDAIILRPNTTVTNSIGAQQISNLGNEVCDIVFDEQRIGLYQLLQTHRGRWNVKINQYTQKK